MLHNDDRLDCHQSVLAANSPVFDANVQSPLVKRDPQTNQILIEAIDCLDVPSTSTDDRALRKWFCDSKIPSSVNLPPPSSTSANQASFINLTSIPSESQIHTCTSYEHLLVYMYRDESDDADHRQLFPTNVGHMANLLQLLEAQKRVRSKHFDRTKKMLRYSTIPENCRTLSVALPGEVG